MVSSRASTMVIEPCSNHPFTLCRKRRDKGFLFLPGSGCPSEVSKNAGGCSRRASQHALPLSRLCRRLGARDVEAEHQAIYDAVLTRDADRAVAAANLHIHKTTDSVVARESDFAGIARVA
jgi:hypothetical protein